MLVLIKLQLFILYNIVEGLSLIATSGRVSAVLGGVETVDEATTSICLIRPPLRLEVYIFSVGVRGVF